MRGCEGVVGGFKFWFGLSGRVWWVSWLFVWWFFFVFWWFCCFFEFVKEILVRVVRGFREIKFSFWVFFILRRVLRRCV